MDDSLNLDKLMAENEEYEKFVDKFKPKKTTDDCYTPDNIYACVKDWVLKRYSIPRSEKIVRPFWPGADYQQEEYPDGCVVIDNPPFSMLAKITRWFQERKIRFFLFAPALTIFKPDEFLSYVMIDQSIVYQNGAEVATSFVTNMAECLVQSAPDLDKEIKVLNGINRRNGKAELPKYTYPVNVLMASDVRRYAKYGIEFEIQREDAHFVRSIDANKEKGLYGAGFLISNRAAADRAAAEKKKAYTYELSQREQQIVRSLGG